jgi:excisionase family DNA binding protein
MSRYLTVAELAEALRRSRDSVYRDYRLGRIPALRVGARGRLLFDVDDVRAALRHKSQPAPTPNPAA